jgi:hypothetical protein
VSDLCLLRQLTEVRDARGATYNNTIRITNVRADEQAADYFRSVQLGRDCCQKRERVFYSFGSTLD